jgi:hypothetical protein
MIATFGEIVTAWYSCQVNKFNVENAYIDSLSNFKYREGHWPNTRGGV